MEDYDVQIYVGTHETSLEDVIQAINVHCHQIDKKLRKVELLSNGLPRAERNKYINTLTAKRGFTYDEYLWLFDGSLDEERYHHHPAFNFLQIVSDVQRRYYTTRYADDPESYILLLKAKAPKVIERFFSRRDTFIPLWKIVHGYVSGRSGSGKSTLLEGMFLRIAMKMPNAPMIFCDPHGTSARKIARFKEFFGSDRLVYIDLDPKDGYCPTINPLYIKLEGKSEREKLRMLDEYTSRVVDVIADLSDQDFTSQMKTAIKPFIKVLLKREGSTLLDLHRFFDRSDNEDLMELLDAESKLDKRKVDRLLSKKGGSPKEEGILYRIEPLIDNYDIRQFLCGKNTIDLEEALDNNKVVIINLEKVPRSLKRMVGLFVFSIVSHISFTRSFDASQRLYFFFDELENFVSGKLNDLLNEARKYNVVMMLASQYIEQIRDEKAKKAIEVNCNLKALGDNQPDQLKPFLSGMGLTAYDVAHVWGGHLTTERKKEKFKAMARQLKSKRGNPRQLYNFFMKVSNEQTVLFKSDNTFSRPEYQMSKKEWGQTLEEQLAKYYRKIDPFTTEQRPLDDKPYDF